MSENLGPIVLHGEVDGEDFYLREDYDLHQFRWYLKDGTRTELWHFSVEECKTVLMAKGPEYVRELRKHEKVVV